MGNPCKLFARVFALGWSGGAGVVRQISFVHPDEVTLNKTYELLID